MASRQAVTKWLLDGDAAIRWQVMRDLTHEPDAVVAAERRASPRRAGAPSCLACNLPTATGATTPGTAG